MPALPGSLALTSIADGSNIVAADHRNNYAAVQTAVNALIADLGGGTAGQVLRALSSSSIGWDTTPHITTSTMAGGPPGSPSDGDIWIATAVDANGTRWAFQYNAGSASASKWEFIGGPDAYLSVETEETTASAAYADLTTVGPSFTFARAGDYLLGFGCEMFNDTAVSPLHNVAVKRGAAAAADADCVIGNTWTAANTVLDASRGGLKVSPAAADVYKLVYKTSAATAHFRKRWLRVTPIRAT